MIKFNTKRGLATYECYDNERERVFMARSDYEHALKNEEFAKYHGGIENLKKDLLLFTKLLEEATDL